MELLEEKDFLLEHHNLQETKADWCIIEENSTIKVGMYSPGSEVYLDLFARRFYSKIEIKGLSRKVYPAKIVPTSEKEMIAFEAIDDPKKFIVLSKHFVQKIYDTSVYDSWMEEELVL